MDRTSPKTRTSGCAFAAPATASTGGVSGNIQILVEIFASNGFRTFVVLTAVAQLAPHFPAHPEQQQATTHEQGTSKRQQPRGGERKNDTQNRCGNDAHKNGPGPLLFGQPGSGKADDNRIVSGQHQVNHDDLTQGGEGFVGEKKIEQVAHRL
jgi:hypothetical protein